MDGVWYGNWVRSQRSLALVAGMKKQMTMQDDKSQTLKKNLFWDQSTQRCKQLLGGYIIHFMHVVTTKILNIPCTQASRVTH